MPKKQRTEVKGLPKEEKNLSEKDLKKVKGGTHVQFNPKEFKLDDKVSWTTKTGGK